MRDLLVRDLMSAPPIWISPEATLHEAEALMDTERVRRLPVVDADGRLVGIVSRSDLLRVFLQAAPDMAAFAQEYSSRAVVEPYPAPGCRWLAWRIVKPTMVSPS